MKTKKQEEMKPEKTAPAELDDSQLEDISGGEYGDLLRPLCIKCGKPVNECQC